MTNPRFGAGDLGPGGNTPGPSSFPRDLPGFSRDLPGFFRDLPGQDAGALDPASPAPSSHAIRSAAAFPDAGPSASGFPAAGSPHSESPLAGPSLALPPTEIAAAAAQVFKERLSLAGRYAELLGTEGVVRGLIGPRETPRLWERHLVNCGVMSEIIPFGASVVDVGSGAGLPGIVLAVARPDLAITLVEPLARRTAFLEEAVSTLGLDGNVTVVRGRAEEVAAHLPGADIVTARAVAALDKLAGWCLPLARTDGRLLALKGASAADEIATHGEAVAALGGGEPVVRLCGVGLIDPPATVVDIVKERHVVPGRARAAGGSAPGAAKAGSARRDGGRRRSRRG
ncbi:16S rRNA (guanine(527)-N(7))-methyltransferase RsmG [Actinoplanes sp. NBC_00393]|uniref:16S rRNA (guanine(527)-N(7))-methyltransferase RsmG n=1 Tax=Actinoplanes sp. NBC_00393 TaxID=2975953 RepID=UPI002E20FCA6